MITHLYLCTLSTLTAHGGSKPRLEQSSVAMQAFRRGRRAAGRIADEHALLGVAGIGVVVLSLNYSQPHTAGSPEGQRPRSHGSGGRHFWGESTSGDGKVCCTVGGSCVQRYVGLVILCALLRCYGYLNTKAARGQDDSRCNKPDLE